MAGDTARRSLIVNADDLGLHVDIDRGIEKAFRDGIVTATSICAVGETFDNGVDLCHRCPELDVGVHLTLVGERPLTDPGKLGGLVTRDGNFPDGHQGLIKSVLSGRVGRDEVHRELEAQVTRVKEAGLDPSHLDSHQHVHLLPRIWPVVLALAKRHGIRWVRVPAFRPLGVGAPGAMLLTLRLGLNALERVRRRTSHDIRTVDETPLLGMSGHLTSGVIRKGMEGVPPGALVELVAHPGVTTPSLEGRYDWGFDWTGETRALTDPELRRDLAASGVQLRSFANEAA